MLEFSLQITIPADVDALIEDQRNERKNVNRRKPPRGFIIAQAVRACFGSGVLNNGNRKRPPVAAS